MTKLDKLPSRPRRRSDSSANVALLQEVWKQANNSDKHFELPCGTAEEAGRMRMALYNAVRNARATPADYPTLAEAVDNCEVVLKDGDKSTLLIRKKALTPRMVAVRRLLAMQGVKVEDDALGGTPERRELAESMQRIIGQLPAPAVMPPDAPPPVELPGEGETSPSAKPAIANPFYTRTQQ